MEAVIYEKNEEEYKMLCNILEKEAELIDIYRDPADGFCHYEHEYDLVVVALEGAKGMNVFLPGESQEQGSLVGFRLWGHTQSDTTEVT